MANYQQTQIIGHVGNDPEMRYIRDEIPVCNFSVAVTEKWNDTEETTWYRVAAWRKLAETCSQYVHKGMLVHVVGKVSASAYAGNDGSPAVSLELTARSVTFLSPKKERDDERMFDDNNGADDGRTPF